MPYGRPNLALLGFLLLLLTLKNGTTNKTFAARALHMQSMLLTNTPVHSLHWSKVQKFAELWTHLEETTTQAESISETESESGNEAKYTEFILMRLKHESNRQHTCDSCSPVAVFSSEQRVGEHQTTCQRAVSWFTSYH